jgi:transposase-like protein
MLNDDSPRILAEQCTHWTGARKSIKKRDNAKIMKRYRELYDLGRSDADIARATGRSESSVLQWRRRNGLAAQGVPGRKGKETERMG